MGQAQNNDHASTESQPYTYYVRDEPIMKAALDVFSLLNKHGKSILLAKGNSIPSAVSIANILVEKMLHNACKVKRISLDSENVFGKKMLSTIEIVLTKN
jgi:DNA-binding protein